VYLLGDVLIAQAFDLNDMHTLSPPIDCGVERIVFKNELPGEAVESSLFTEVFSKTGNDGSATQNFNIIQQDSMSTTGSYALYYTISMASYPQISKAYVTQFAEPAFTVEIEVQPVSCDLTYPVSAISFTCPVLEDENSEGGGSIVWLADQPNVTHITGDSNLVITFNAGECRDDSDF
jgi:hypothetical protein